MTEHHHEWDRKSVRDRVAKIGQPILISIVILSLIANVVLTVVLYSVVTDGHAETQQLIQKSITASNNHHDSVVTYQKQVLALQKVTNMLLQQHSDDLALLQKEQASLAAAEGELSAAGNYIAAWDAWFATAQAPICAIPVPHPGTFCATPPPTPPPGLG